jgi:hypothetical protein
MHTSTELHEKGSSTDRGDGDDDDNNNETDDEDDDYVDLSPAGKRTFFCNCSAGESVRPKGLAWSGPNARQNWARIRDRKRKQWRGRNRNNCLVTRILPHRPRTKISNLPFGNRETMNRASRRRMMTKSPTKRHLRNTIMMTRRYPKVQPYLDRQHPKHERK